MTVSVDKLNKTLSALKKRHDAVTDRFSSAQLDFKMIEKSYMELRGVAYEACDAAVDAAAEALKSGAASGTTFKDFRGVADVKSARDYYDQNVKSSGTQRKRLEGLKAGITEALKELAAIGGDVNKAIADADKKNLLQKIKSKLKKGSDDFERARIADELRAMLDQIKMDHAEIKDFMDDEINDQIADMDAGFISFDEYFQDGLQKSPAQRQAANDRKMIEGALKVEAQRKIAREVKERHAAVKAACDDVTAALAGTGGKDLKAALQTMQAEYKRLNDIKRHQEGVVKQVQALKRSGRDVGKDGQKVEDGATASIKVIADAKKQMDAAVRAVKAASKSGQQQAG